jgi:uncharacterized membrane protein
MKTIWKWVIGIVIGLVVLAVLVGVGFAIRGNFHVYRAETQLPRQFSQRAPGLIPYGGNGIPMRRPGMMSFGFFPLGGILGGLFCLGFIALVVIGIILLVKALRKPKTASPVTATPEAPVEAAVVTPSEEIHTCKKCGQPLQAEWKNCPYCGKKI